MNHIHFVFIISAIVLVNFVVNCNYSREICIWAPSVTKKITLLALLWLVPIVGAAYLYHQKNLSPLRHYKQHEMNTNDLVSGFLTEIDSISNPGKRHMLKAIEQQKVIRYERNKSNDSKNAEFSQFDTIIVNRPHKDVESDS